MLEGRRASDRADSGWHSDALWQAMRPHCPSLVIEVVRELASTNSTLVERYRRLAQVADRRATRADDLQATLLVAEQQTHGRGRMGRHWLSQAGQALTFSLALPLQRSDWSGLSLAVGVAVAQALDPQARTLGLKWPNDVWTRQDDRKLGGILIEGLSVGTQRVAVIGIGLNVRQAPTLTGAPTACLAEWDAACTPASVLARLGEPLIRALMRFDQEGFAPFADDFAALDLLAGRDIVTTDPACPQGRVLGVGRDGALRVQHQGREMALISGEVSVRPQGSRPGADGSP